MNHIYRLCWSRSLRQWVVASELARRRPGNGASKASQSARRAITVLATCVPFLWAGTVYAAVAPVGGQITAGSGMISQSGATTTIQQRSPTRLARQTGFRLYPVR